MKILIVSCAPIRMIFQNSVTIVEWLHTIGKRNMINSLAFLVYYSILTVLYYDQRDNTALLETNTISKFEVCCQVYESVMDVPEISALTPALFQTLHMI